MAAIAMRTIDNLTLSLFRIASFISELILSYKSIQYTSLLAGKKNTSTQSPLFEEKRDFKKPKNLTEEG
jgi:hypothetical protein